MIHTTGPAASRTATAPRRNRRRAWPVATAGGVAIALLLAACGGSGEGREASDAQANADAFNVTGDPLAPRPLKEKQTVVVGIGEGLEVYSQFLLAKKLGEFEKENIEVKAENVLEPDKLAMLSQGRMDVAYNAMTAGVLNLMQTAGGVKFAFPGAAYDAASKQGFWYNKEAFGGKEPEPKDLVGKKILTPSGNASISAFYLWKWVNDNDPSVKLSDLKFEAVPPNDIAVAMSNGSAAVAQVVAPGSTLLGADACCEFIDVGYPSYPVIGWIGSDAFLNERSDVAMAFFRAMARTQKQHLQGDYHADAETAPVLAEQLGQKPADLARHPALLFSTELPLGEQTLEAQTYWRELGLLNYEENLGMDKAYDERYVDVLRG